MKVFDEKSLICDEQYGFRYKKSMVDKIRKFIRNVNRSWDKYVLGVCKDFSCAFDSIWKQVS